MQEMREAPPGDAAEMGMEADGPVRIPVGYGLKNGLSDSDVAKLVSLRRVMSWEDAVSELGLKVTQAALERWRPTIEADAAKPTDQPVLPPNHPSFQKRPAAAPVEHGLNGLKAHVAKPKPGKKARTP